MIDDKNTLP